MRSYARIESGAIAELLVTDQDITRMFHPSLHWVDVTGQPVGVGWVITAQGFAAPSSPPPQPPAAPTLAQLQAELAALTARVAAIVPQV